MKIPTWMVEYCSECDRVIEVDEPQTCYYTGGGPCGDCRDPRTGKPPFGERCFGPLLCVECDEREGRGHPLAETEG